MFGESVAQATVAEMKDNRVDESVVIHETGDSVPGTASTGD